MDQSQKKIFLNELHRRGFKDLDALITSLVSNLKRLALEAIAERNPSAEILREKCSYCLDMALFGTAPADKIDPRTTPYEGMAKGLELAFKNRETVYTHLMGIRRTLLEKLLTAPN